MAFGSFEDICAQSSLPLCFLLGPPTTITSLHNPLYLSRCSARSIELANTIIFQAATDFAHLVALFMTAIMIFHVRSKFTAVGRKEILTFFYIYTLLTIISLVLDAGVLQATNQGPFPWFVAVQNGLSSALCASLLINGFVGFQLYEDGTKLSVWLLRLTSVIFFAITFAVSIMTFNAWAGLGPTNTTALFIVLYIINAICVAVYVVMQVILVANTLQDRWPLGDIVFGVFFFVIGQVILYVFAASLCEGVSHYLDGLFFATVCNLLAVMMVYKYWDSITKEDLEFSVGTKQGNWEVKEPFLDHVSEDYRTSTFGGTGGRESIYETSSLDYRPQSGHQYLGNNSSTTTSHHYNHYQYANQPTSPGLAERRHSHGQPQLQPSIQGQTQSESKRTSRSDTRRPSYTESKRSSHGESKRRSAQVTVNVYDDYNGQSQGTRQRSVERSSYRERERDYAY